MWYLFRPSSRQQPVLLHSTQGPRRHFGAFVAIVSLGIPPTNVEHNLLSYFVKYFINSKEKKITFYSHTHYNIHTLQLKPFTSQPSSTVFVSES